MAAGERLGTVAAGVVTERQPDECGTVFADLDAKPGEDSRSLLRRYVLYVRGPINARIRNCFLFNQTQLDRLAAAGT